jgi:hypothetical protein
MDDQVGQGRGPPATYKRSPARASAGAREESRTPTPFRAPDPKVWIEEVEGPVPPRPVHRAGEELDAEAPEPLGFGIDVVDEEEDLAGRPALGGLTVDQVGCTCALEEPEFRLAGDELRVSRIAEFEGEPESVPIERDRRLHIADVQDHIADALHGHHGTIGCPPTEKLRELQGSVATIVVPGPWHAVLVQRRDAVPGSVDAFGECLPGVRPDAPLGFPADRDPKLRKPALPRREGTGFVQALREAPPSPKGRWPINTYTRTIEGGLTRWSAVRFNCALDSGHVIDGE